MMFLRALIINAVGVTTIKKTNPITIGDIILPRKIPNLNHNLFKGVKILEFIRPRKINNEATISDHARKFSSKKSG